MEWYCPPLRSSQNRYSDSKHLKLCWLSFKMDHAWGVSGSPQVCSQFTHRQRYLSKGTNQCQRFSTRIAVPSALTLYLASYPYTRTSKAPFSHYSLAFTISLGVQLHELCLSSCHAFLMAGQILTTPTGFTPTEKVRCDNKEKGVIIF